jgi:hypothetical protein
MEEAARSLLFVLGLQRSGTTWIANILDLSPDTLLFMEPFAPAYGLFPEIPDQGFFLASAPPETTRVLRDEAAERLLRKKRLLSARSLTDPRRFRLERAAARLVSRLGRYVPSRIERRAAQFTLLNLNRFETSYPLYPKHRDPRHWVIKELRFAGKVPLLQAAFPQARYLVVLRSPHATVHSMLQWFSRGGLGEVKRELDAFVEKLECQQIGGQYAAQIARARAGGTAHRAALYWRVCYEQMVSTLEDGPSVRLLPYEALASQSVSETRDLLEWAGIPWAESVARYLDYSTGSETENPAAINTVRRSGTYYRSWEAKIAPEVRQAVDEIVQGSPLLDHFRPFYAHSGADA